MLTLDQMVGQEKIKAYFQRARAVSHLSHAYILSGEEGMGKKTLAQSIALLLVCEKGGHSPCLCCHACRQVLAHSHPDVIELVKEKSISVDDIRSKINDTVDIRPFSAPVKIYIIDHAERMNVQAQNALLKTIEEPPSYVIIFLLTTNREVFLDTIQSRCIHLRMQPLPVEVVAQKLKESYPITDMQAREYATYARGNLGRAKNLLEDEAKRIRYQKNVKILKDIGNFTLEQMVKVLAEMKEEDSNFSEFLQFIRDWYRDVLIVLVGADVRKLIFSTEMKTMKEKAEQYSLTKVNQILEAVDLAQDRIQANVKAELAMQMLLMEMKVGEDNG